MSIDIIKQFMKDCVIFGNEIKIEKETLYKVYRNWCEENKNDAESSLPFKRKFLKLCEGFDVVPSVSRKDKDCKYFYLRVGLNSWSQNNKSLHK